MSFSVPMAQVELQLEIDAELRERVVREVIRRVLAAVSANEERNRLLQEYADMAEGMGQTTKQPWSNSCQITHPFTFEQVTMLKSYLMGSLRNPPYCLIEATSPGDESAAAQLEGALTAKTEQWGIKRSLDGIAENAVIYPYAPTFTYWRQRLRTLRSLVPVDPETGEEVDAVTAQREGIDASTPASILEVVDEGPFVRVIHPEDYYHYPPQVVDVEDASLCIERMYLTREDLYRGMMNEGYEKEEVMRLLSRGPTGYFDSDSVRQTEMEDSGVRPVEEGVYECFQVIGRMPLIWDEQGRMIIPEEYLEDDFLFMVCPDAGICFKFVAYPGTMRGYTIFRISNRAGRFSGRCVPYYTEQLQAELTNLLRFKMDIAELIASPSMKVPERDMDRYVGQQMYPGKFWFYNQRPDEIQPFVWDMSGFPILVQSITELLAYGDRLMAAQGLEQISTPPGQPPTATQVTAVGGSVALKRDLFLQTFNEGVERLFQIIVSLWAQYMPGEGETTRSRHGVHSVTADDLKRRYRFIPHANSDAANPQVRLVQNQMKREVQRTYFQSLLQFTPDRWPQLYHGARRILEEMNERSVEAWLGREPTEGSAEQTLSQVMQMLQAAAQSGDSAAQMILQQTAMRMGGGGQNLIEAMETAPQGMEAPPFQSGSRLPMQVLQGDGGGNGLLAALQGA